MHRVVTVGDPELQAGNHCQITYFLWRNCRHPHTITTRSASSSSPFLTAQHRYNHRQALIHITQNFSMVSAKLPTYWRLCLNGYLLGGWILLLSELWMACFNPNRCMQPCIRDPSFWVPISGAITKVQAQWIHCWTALSKCNIFSHVLKRTSFYSDLTPLFAFPHSSDRSTVLDGESKKVERDRQSQLASFFVAF